MLKVNFNMTRHAGYFLIQVYLPCGLIVVLSWVSFWINREATSDRVGLGITAVLTLSTISLDSRTDLPKVHYATALDWFLLMSFAYCMSTLLEFAGVHYFTKVGTCCIFKLGRIFFSKTELFTWVLFFYGFQVGSGEAMLSEDDEWEEMGEEVAPAPDWPESSEHSHVHHRTPLSVSEQINCSTVYNIRPQEELVG